MTVMEEAVEHCGDGGELPPPSKFHPKFSGHVREYARGLLTSQ
jgi:hypothetical protein